MNEKETGAEEAAVARKNEDWEQRRLCSDGNCIGVIGADGRCKECGRPEAGRPEPLDPPPVAAAAAERPLEAEAATGSDDDWSQRRLCSDGSCIGVIGADGRCKECGRPPVD